MKSPLVSTDWLQANLDSKNVVILDASMSKIIGREPIFYEADVYIPNSKKLDLEKAFCDPASDQTHAFPTEAQFTVEAQNLGINSDSTVIIYDNQGIYSAPRAWWIFQAMGLKNSYVLDGGLPKWLSEDRQTTPVLSQGTIELGDIQGEYQSNMVCDSRYLLENTGAEHVAIVDARSVERFKGLAPEPRQGARSGHIPGSLNLPFSRVLNEHSFKEAQQLETIFSQMIDIEAKQLVFSCGSGVTACIILLAAVMAGYEKNVLYDGSWSDWGSDKSLPVEKLE
jgi:thiosulfate/3-mercaptopyruvate sulfurtransferase